MLSDHSVSIDLPYGRTGRFRYRSDTAHVAGVHNAPRALGKLSSEIQKVISHPLEFPPLENAVVAGDHITLAIDRNTPHAATIVAEVWRLLERQSIAAEDVVVIQPASWTAQPLDDPRSELPDDVRQLVKWVIHDPTDEANRRYLAATASGDRVYLAAEVTEADFVLPIGQIAFDPLIGFRGTNSVLYPGLSSTDAIARAHGQGHRELSPTDDRPLRQMMDEIAWLLGIQFSIQVIAGAQGGVSHVLAGAVDAVFRRGKELLTQEWMVNLDSRPQMVVAAIDIDASGHGWEQMGTALEVASNLVSSGGKIVLLTQVDADPGDGVRMIRESESPRDSLQQLRTILPPDLIPATQLAHAVDWAHVYLMSGLDGGLVEDLFMTPLENDREVERLLEANEGTVFLGGAQNACGWVRSS